MSEHLLEDIALHRFDDDGAPAPDVDVDHTAEQQRLAEGLLEPGECVAWRELHGDIHKDA